MSEEEMHALVAQAGVRVLPIVIGVAGGVALALGARYGLGQLEVEDGRIYSGSDVIIGALATCFAVMARRIRRNSTTQAVIAASSYGILLFGGLLLLGAAFSIFMVTNLAVLIFIGALLGSVSEMA